MENFKEESVLKVVRKKAMKTPLKPPSMNSTYHQSPGKEALRITEQSAVALSEREQTSMTPRESARLNESARSTKPDESSPESSVSELQQTV